MPTDKTIHNNLEDNSTDIFIEEDAWNDSRTLKKAKGLFKNYSNNVIDIDKEATKRLKESIIEFYSSLVDLFESSGYDDAEMVDSLEAFVTKLSNDDYWDKLNLISGHPKDKTLHRVIGNLKYVLTLQDKGFRSSFSIKQLVKDIKSIK